MHFNHDNMLGVHAAVDLVNLADAAWSHDALSATLTLHDFAHPDLDAPAVEELRNWARRLRTVFEAPDADARCSAVNALLAAGAGRAHLSTHDGLRPHLHFVPEGAGILERVRAVTAGGLALFTVEAAGARVGACARSGCRRVFVDVSRNGTRAYCSARCGNAAAVTRHRTRS
ncbi:CGNR zinc finger domain-containing protein [Cellulomonas cellasea]|uniref:Putative RNA-binding Zn ribbon-like protein n=1 Tax=Cellulomonas cellasea TaxID=43670 RepID=A0A7W4UBQ7_9CELL|nr:CGNR zinc finger domain-containing protein [Cellulomonas cellasea]MBB2921252.1 putative RNA-binding Zn ribbon-like protein [Cellulomonas cellasea]